MPRVAECQEGKTPGFLTPAPEFTSYTLNIKAWCEKEPETSGKEYGMAQGSVCQASIRPWIPFLPSKKDKTNKTHGRQITARKQSCPCFLSHWPFSESPSMFYYTPLQGRSQPAQDENSPYF